MKCMYRDETVCFECSDWFTDPSSSKMPSCEPVKLVVLGDFGFSQEKIKHVKTIVLVISTCQCNV